MTEEEKLQSNNRKYICSKCCVCAISDAGIVHKMLDNLVLFAANELDDCSDSEVVNDKISQARQYLKDARESNFRAIELLQIAKKQLREQAGFKEQEE